MKRIHPTARTVAALFQQHIEPVLLAATAAREAHEVSRGILLRSVSDISPLSDSEIIALAERAARRAVHASTRDLLHALVEEMLLALRCLGCRETVGHPVVDHVLLYRRLLAEVEANAPRELEAVAAA